MGTRLYPVAAALLALLALGARKGPPQIVDVKPSGACSSEIVEVYQADGKPLESWCCEGYTPGGAPGTWARCASGPEVLVAAAGPEYNVTHARWGAVPGDGLDDRAAIQAALDAADAPVCGRVYLPRGVYDVTRNTTTNEGVTVGSCATLFGDGKDSVLRGEVTASGQFFKVIGVPDGAADVLIRDLVIDGRQAEQVAATDDHYGLWSGTRLSTGGSNDGTVAGVDRLTLDNITVRNIAGTGLQLRWKNRNARIVNSYWHNLELRQIYIQGGSGTLVQNNVVDMTLNGSTAIKIEDPAIPGLAPAGWARNISVRNNTVICGKTGELCGGIHLTGDEEPLHYLPGLVVEDNRVLYTNPATNCNTGIAVTHTLGAVISNNTVDGCRNQSAIEVGVTSIGTRVTGNSILNQGADQSADTNAAIDVQSTSGYGAVLDTILEGNVIETGWIGIFVGGDGGTERPEDCTAAGVPYGWCTGANAGAGGAGSLERVKIIGNEIRSFERFGISLRGVVDVLIEGNTLRQADGTHRWIWMQEQSAPLENKRVRIVGNTFSLPVGVASSFDMIELSPTSPQNLYVVDDLAVIGNSFPSSVNGFCPITSQCTGSGAPWTCCSGAGAGCSSTVAPIMTAGRCDSNADCPATSQCTASGEPWPCCTGSGAGTCQQLCVQSGTVRGYFSDTGLIGGTLEFHGNRGGIPEAFGQVTAHNSVDATNIVGAKVHSVKADGRITFAPDSIVMAWDAAAGLASYPAKVAWVNFECDGDSSGCGSPSCPPNGTCTPVGFIRDSGLAYTTVRGYGWTQGLGVSSPRERATANPTEKDTLVQSAFERTWQMDLANGAYSVETVVGDSSFPTLAQRLFVEGEVANDTGPGTCTGGGAQDCCADVDCPEQTSACTGSGTPFACCTGSGLGTCGCTAPQAGNVFTTDTTAISVADGKLTVVAQPQTDDCPTNLLCTGSGTPWFCCSAGGAGTCAGQSALWRWNYLKITRTDLTGDVKLSSAFDAPRLSTDQLNMGGVTDCSAVAEEGTACWESDANQLWMGDGAAPPTLVGAGDITQVGNVASGAAFDGTAGSIFTLGVAGGSTDPSTLTASDSPFGKPRVVIDSTGVDNGRVISREQIMIGGSLDGDENADGVGAIQLMAEGGTGLTSSPQTLVQGTNLLVTHNFDAAITAIGGTGTFIIVNSGNQTTLGPCTASATPKACCIGNNDGACWTGLRWRNDTDEWWMYIDGVATQRIWP